MGKPRLPENSAPIIISLIVVRITGAIYNLIYDCDETYNYWEIGHCLIYKNCYIPWEYSPDYALRSYLYPLIYLSPSFILSFITSNEVILFYFTRIAIACLGVFCELYFCIGLARCAGESVARYCMAFMLMSSGMYFASTSLLPNTLSMHMTMIAYGAWFCDHYKLTVFAAGISILIGWPYAAIVYTPIAFSMLISRRKQLFFIFLTLIYVVVILTPMIIVDAYNYGKFVIAPLNAVLYNVFNPQAGPELYGVESILFYPVNLFLNFNLVFIGSLFSAPMLILIKIFMTRQKHKMSGSSHIYCVSSMLLWFGLFSLQAHKEERFMYPIYPLICATSAFTIKVIETFATGTKKHSSPVFKVIVCICCLAFLGLSLSRVVSLHSGFRATVDVFSDLKKSDVDGSKPKFLNQTGSADHINVCMGKDWYRYPSSFHLPNSKRYRMRFIRSDFRGQLPKLYDANDATARNKAFYSDFNNMNKETMSRYINPSECHYLIDSSAAATSEHEPSYASQKDWQVLSSHKMLDLNNSPVILRSFYLPFISDKQNTYVDYQLLRNVNLFSTS